MKHLFIAGNWKSKKTAEEAKIWHDDFILRMKDVSLEMATVVVFPPYTAIPALRALTQSSGIGISLGSQDVSGYGEGAFTGEVTGGMIKEFATWVLIGHSERRKYFGETDEQLQKKVEQAKLAGLSVVYCVPDDTTVVPAGVDVIAYEPVWAIGTGKTDTPDNASAVVSNIKSKTGVNIVIYGGSVTDENVASFVGTNSIDGVLPGGASLDPVKFANLIKNAIS